MGDISKKGKILTGETKKVVLTCLRLETGSNIYYFWSFTMHSISSSIFFAALVQIYSVLLEENKIYCSSQRFIHGENLKWSTFFTDETKKLVLTCLRLETGSNIYYF